MRSRRSSRRSDVPRGREGARARRSQALLGDSAASIHPTSLRRETISRSELSMFSKTAAQAASSPPFFRAVRTRLCRLTELAIQAFPCSAHHGRGGAGLLDQLPVGENELHQPRVPDRVVQRPMEVVVQPGVPLDVSRPQAFGLLVINVSNRRMYSGVRSATAMRMADPSRIFRTSNSSAKKSARERADDHALGVARSPRCPCR